MSENEYSLAKLTTLTESAKEFIEASLSKGTRRIYKSCWNIFNQWCDERKLIALPATPETICLFLTDQSQKGLSKSSLIIRLASIKLCHDTKGYLSPTLHSTVERAFRGINRVSNRQVIKKAPITVERLESIISQCPVTLAGLRDKAILLLGFAGAFRRSELVALTINDIERTPEGIKVIIRRSKTDQEGKGYTLAILNGTRFRVVDTLYDWLKQAGIQEGFLFRRMRKGNSVQHAGLTSHAVAVIVKKYARLSGLTVEKFSGHSLRSGFLTSAAKAGASINKMMEVSRHTDIQTLIGYVRNENLFENHAAEKVL